MKYRSEFVRSLRGCLIKEGRLSLMALVALAMLSACGNTDYKQQSQAGAKKDPTSLGDVQAALSMFSAFGKTDYKPQSQAGVRNDPTSLGVVNRKGEWIMPPIFKEIVYLTGTNSFWVKEREPTNSSWKLVDADGKVQSSQLPEAESPLREWPPSQALGFTAYPDALAVIGPDGAGLNAPNGRPFTPCKYHTVQDVGEGLWMIRAGQRTPTNAKELFVPQASLGNVFALPPPFELFDSQGTKIKTLSNMIAIPEGYFNDGRLVCGTYGRGYVVIDKTGVVVEKLGVPIPIPKAKWHSRMGAARSFNSFYNLPVSAASPVKLIDISKKTNLPSEVEPVPVAEGLALARTQDDMVGLINRKGEWIMPPDYNRLAYCNADRFVCSKGRLSMSQDKALKEEISQPDVR